MKLKIIPADSKSALKEFIQLPPRLYREYTTFTPPLTMERNGIFDPEKSPFFTHGRAQYWLAYRNSQAVGRISAQIDDSQPEKIFGNTGLFGSLDAIDDIDVVGALLGQAEAWLKEQGVDYAFGPCTLSMNEEPGLLVEGQDEPPLIMAPWHPPYLAAHVEACGYPQCRELHYWRFNVTDESVNSAKQVKLPDSRRLNIQIRPLDMANLREEVEVIRKVYNDAWSDNWGFVPIQSEDLEGISKDLKHFLNKDCGLFVEMDGKTVGVAMFIPNLFEVTADLGANPSLLGWGKLGYRMFRHRFRSGRVILLGVLSEYRHSMRGAMIAMAMVDAIIARRSSHDLDWIEAGWVLDNNKPLQKILEQFNFTITRTLRLYKKSI